MTKLLATRIGYTLEMGSFRAGVVVVKDGAVLLLFRRKQGEEYYVLPGGSLEKKESIEEGAIREAKEETGLTVELKKKLWEFEDDDGRVHHYFLVDTFTGEPMLGGEEAIHNSPQNFYKLDWIPFAALHDTHIISSKVKSLLLEEFAN